MSCLNLVHTERKGKEEKEEEEVCPVYFLKGVSMSYQALPNYCKYYCSHLKV